MRIKNWCQSQEISQARRAGIDVDIAPNLAPEREWNNWTAENVLDKHDEDVSNQE